MPPCFQVSSFHVSMFLCLDVFMSLCFHDSMFSCLHVSMSSCFILHTPCLNASMTPCFHISIFHVSMSPCLYVSMSPCFHVFKCPCFQVSSFLVSMFSCPCFNVSVSPSLHVFKFPCLHAPMPPYFHVSMNNVIKSSSTHHCKQSATYNFFCISFFAVPEFLSECHIFFSSDFCSIPRCLQNILDICTFSFLRKSKLVFCLALFCEEAVPPPPSRRPYNKDLHCGNPLRVFVFQSIFEILKGTVMSPV